jgi:hypothetical protein
MFLVSFVGMKKGHAEWNESSNATGHVRPLAKAENLPVDESGIAQSKIF